MQEGREWPPSFSHSLAPSWYLTYLGTTPTIINAMFPFVLVQFYVTSVIPLYYCLKCNMSTCHWKQSLPSRAPALRTMNPAAAQLQKGKGIFSVHGVSRASGDWSQTRFKPSSRYDFTWGPEVGLQFWKQRQNRPPQSLVVWTLVLPYQSGL